MCRARALDTMSYKGQSCEVRPAQGERVKPAPFQYRVTRSVAEATDALAEFGDAAAVLAGGQSLVPLLNLRLARPAVVVDINPVSELGTHTVSPDAVAVGAMVRARQLERCDDVATVVPLLRRALSFVAHPQIRSRTTIGGNIAHADPAAELPAVLVALGGTVTVTSSAGERDIAAADFFQGPMMTAVGEGELITAVTFPVARHDALGVRRGRPTPWRLRHGRGMCGPGLRRRTSSTEAVVVLAGCGPHPVRCSAGEAALVGHRVGDDLGEVVGRGEPVDHSER